MTFVNRGQAAITCHMSRKPQPPEGITFQLAKALTRPSIR